MTHYEIVKKLIGPISPLGDSSRDPQRLQNLKELTHLVEGLITDIDDVAYLNRESREHSVKEIADHAKKFLDDLGIE